MDHDPVTNDRESDRTSPPPLIPDHELLRCIGRGSYGEVWLARNMMGVYRAVKIVHRKSFEQQRPFDRELAGIRKFEPISRSHEGFVDVLHVGINPEQGYFYYVMEVGDDQTSGQTFDPQNYAPRTLARDISIRGSLPFAECLPLGLSLSNALADLHQHGLVHRDIKPSNIIFVNGIPKLADIGLVADISEARSYVGTEGFIPPEGPGTVQADIYSLGKVLYEASTGRDRHDFPELPTRLDESPDLDRLVELNEVILHACKDDVSKRYQSVVDLHADLVVVANGRSIKRLKLLERRLAAFKRIAMISLAVIAILAAIFYQVYREWRGAIENRQRKVGADVAIGTRAMDSGDLLGALPYFAEAINLDHADPQRGIQNRVRFGSALVQSPKLVQMWFAPKEVYTASFSPDGRQVLAVEWNGKAQVFDALTAESVSSRFGPAYGLVYGAFSPDGSLVVTASEDRTASVWRFQDGVQLANLEHPKRLISARFSPDGKRVVTASEDGITRVWDTQTRVLQFSFSSNSNALRYAAYSPDGRLIVTASTDNTARLWDARDGQPIGSPLEHPTWVLYAAFSPDSRLLITSCFDRKARVWNLSNHDGIERIQPDMNHTDGVSSAEFSPDGQFIITACLDRAAYLWLAESHQPVRPNPILRHSDRVTRAVFGPDGHRILTACADGTVRIWDLAGGAVAPPPIRNSLSRDAGRFLNTTELGIEVCDTSSGQPVSPFIPTPFTVEAKLNPDGHFVFTISSPKTNSVGAHRELEVWEATSGRRIGSPLRVPSDLANLALNKDGTCLLGYGGPVAQTWSVTTGTPLSPPISHAGNVASAVLGDVGNRVASWSGRDVKVWDATTGRELYAPLKHSHPVKCVAFSQDGALMVTGCSEDNYDKCVAQIWDASTGRALGPALKHNDGVLFAAFDPGGRRVVTTSEDFTAIEWSPTTGAQLVPPLKHEDQVRTADFSPDGRWIVTASSDATARIWSAESGEPLTPALQHPARLVSAKFLAGGRRIITSDKLGKSWIWNIPTDERPNQDQLLLARLLSGVAPPLLSDSNPQQAEALKAMWQQLRLKYPSDFTASAPAAAAWHEHQAAEQEKVQQWFAATFHLQALLVSCPDDRSLTERLARAQAMLKKAEPARGF